MLAGFKTGQYNLESGAKPLGHHSPLLKKMRKGRVRNYDVFIMLKIDYLHVVIT